MKKKINSLISLLLISSLVTGCVSNDSTTETTTQTSESTIQTQESTEQTFEGVVYTPGTYQGIGYGMFGEMLVDVTFSEDAIIAIEVVETGETEKVVGKSYQIMADRIIESQSLMVDTVSSATYASRAILTAVEQAANEASTDISSLKIELVVEPQEKIFKETDVLIIGGGGAGLGAAASAIENGASVIVLEKNEWAGGNTVSSGGAWNAADPELAAQNETSPGQLDTLKAFLDIIPETLGEAKDTLITLQNQINAYISGDTTYMFDSTELHAIQTYTGGIRTDLDGNEISGNFELIKVLCENSLDTRNWVAGFGTPFLDTLVEPSGALWARSLYPGTDAVNLVNLYVNNFENYITDNGSEIMYSTSGTELIVENGVVVGALGVQKDGTEVEVRAKSVILATGGFASNLEMIEEYDNYWGSFPDSIKPTTLPSTVGDAIYMVEIVDASLVGMEAVQMNKGYATTGLHAAETGVDAMFLNIDGERFVNEYAARDVYTLAAIEEGGDYFALMSEESRADFKGIYDSYVFDTVEEMADYFEWDAQELQEEIDKYNSYVDAGVDPDFGKNVFGNKVEAPFYITHWVPVIHHTMGGVEINTDASVINTNGEVIEGLYAAGEVTGGIHGGNRLGGNAIADAFVFGRIAGENAAEYSK